ncbi:MAG: nucleotide sugar dehydrogenase [Saprospiraceae bacterium]
MNKYKIAVIGLGYVGLPLSIAFAEKYKVKAFDLNAKRIGDLQNGNDHTQEVTTDQINHFLQLFDQKNAASGIFFTDDPGELQDCTIYIITVPTPVDEYNAPDLTLLKEATKTVAAILKKNDIVIYESTVYPGCTEEIGVPILEEFSGLRFNIDFYCGYSPERINPGDKSRTISQIQKITSGSTPDAAELVDALYGSIITAGTYRAPSIKVAEAAKVIENTQRDINIAFVNELSKIFALLGIDTQEVLKAAATKWNFLPFKPGLVGGHCIGIDPYYLAHKAKAVGYQPDIILAARKINDSMGEYVAAQVVQLMAKKKILAPGAEVLIMGITFKENFADVRNSRVIDLINALRAFHLTVTIFDPVASAELVKKNYGVACETILPNAKKFAAIVVAVGHTDFLSLDYSLLLQSPGVLFDVKGCLENDLVDGRL